MSTVARRSSSFISATQGELEVKVTFLSEIVEKAISLIGERAVQGRCNMICGRVAAKAKKALADVRACADVDIGPHASRLREEFEDLKSKSSDAVKESMTYLVQTNST